MGMARQLVVVVAGGLAIGAGIGAVTNARDSVRPAWAQGEVGRLPDETSVIRVARQISPAVVGVSQRGSSGSGVLVRNDGVVITNAHVVGNARQVDVSLADGRRLRGTVLGRDPTVDIAVLRVTDRNLPAAPIGDSDGLEVGQQAIAIGNPIGLERTVTTGIISAVNRSPRGFELGGLIQTDAAINRGNSGGPLVNAAGEVIGINTAVIRGGGSEAEGIGLAIAIDTAKPIIDALRNGGIPATERPFLGVSSQDLTPEIRENIKSPADAGAVVAEVVPGSAADDAGLRRLDVIVRIDGRDVQGAVNVGSSIRTKKPGDSVEIEYYRGDEKLTTTATLGTRPAGQS